MGTCAEQGGCPSDYLAIAIAILFFTLLLSKSLLPFLVRKVPRIQGSGFWIALIQVFASFNLLLSLMMSASFFKFRGRHSWQFCYVWAGPLGFGLLLSCRIAQAFQLYYIFVRGFTICCLYTSFLPILLNYLLLMFQEAFTTSQIIYFSSTNSHSMDYWGCVDHLFLTGRAICAVVIHLRKPLNHRCQFGVHWVIPVVFLHALYVATLVVFLGAIRHIEFRFDELKDLWRGIVVSATSLGTLSSMFYKAA
ncbi:hypothetical protein Pint_23618 [Pistacia integerrima]|uniref:Uncharacterized protein n=1 Tax=Pistacia integerrima TaxID=434235 RepID=A0ACC0YLR5_9ROSI|nr:hypothetical protein Pint_23618 [Pistacia integerrima]